MPWQQIVSVSDGQVVSFSPGDVHNYVRTHVNACMHTALGCRRSEVRIPDWAGHGQVNSKPLEG